MEFAVPEELQTLSARIGTFVRDDIIPHEHDPRWTSHGPTDDLREELNGKAKTAGLLPFHVSKGYGGLGLSHFGKAVAFEAAGYSMLGPIALHCAAPDEGNIHLLEEVANPEQKKRFLEPLAKGETRSCFCMTEPAPGAGSDPGQLQTTAEPDGNGFILNGKKWLISGAEGAAFAIIMARTGNGDGEATMFLTELPNPAFKIERVIDTLDSSFTGGHAAVSIEGLRVSGDAVLGEVGKSFRYAQVRLSPARLTHCMRWLGSAIRAHDIATGHARSRTAFGKPLGAHEGVSFMLADNEMDIHMARLSIWHTAWLLDKGDRVSAQSSMAKVFCSEAIDRVADRSLQILGGLGITRDTIVERIYRESRAFRVYDGPSEVHRWALGRRVLEGRMQ